MSDVTDIETLVRSLIQDFSHTLIPGDIFTYSTSSVFTLTETNVLAITTVLVNDASTAGYTYDSASNKLTITDSLTTGDTVEVQYTYYPNYSSTEIDNYVRSSSLHLSANNYCTFEVDTSGNFFPEPTDQEKNLLALIASIMIAPCNKSYRLPDISVSVPKSMPTNDLIRKAIAIFKHNTHGVFTIA